jgi:hypothetical protein
MARLAAAFQKDLIRQEFNFSLRGDFLWCIRHDVHLLRTRLYASDETGAYMEEGILRAASRYLDLRGAAFSFDRLRRVNLRLITLCTGRRMRRESWISRSME